MTLQRDGPFSNQITARFTSGTKTTLLLRLSTHLTGVEEHQSLKVKNNIFRTWSTKLEQGESGVLRKPIESKRIYRKCTLEYGELPEVLGSRIALPSLLGRSTWISNQIADIWLSGSNWLSPKLRRLSLNTPTIVEMLESQKIKLNLLKKRWINNY